MSKENISAEIERSVIADCEFEEPPEKVWRALTRPELVAAWLMPNDMRPEVGQRFTLAPEEKRGGGISCEVLEAEPCRRLRYSWRETQTDRHGQDHHLDSVVTFTLAETPAGGTHLRLVHSGLERRIPVRSTAARAMSLPRRHIVSQLGARRSIPIMACRSCQTAHHGRLKWAA